MDDFNYNDYIDIYPPYSYALRDIKNISDFTFIKKDFQRLWEYLEEVNSLLESLREAITRIQYIDNQIRVRMILENIKEDIEELRDIISEIRSKIKRIPNNQTFDYYLNRIEIEVLDETESYIDNIQYKIKKDYIPIEDLYKFEEKTKEKFKEFEDFVNEVFMHI